MTAPSLKKPPLAQAQLDVELVRRHGLYEFVKLAWPQIESTKFIGGWHLELICAHLEAVSRGEIKRLIINVPPGSSKSTITSVLWPCWDWISRPGRKWMTSTFDSTLSHRDAMRCRGLLRSAWFQARWGHIVTVDSSGDRQDTQGVWHTSKGGLRHSSTVQGGALGWHADIQLVDDPIKPRDVLGDPETARAALDRAWTWWTGTMSSRRTGADFARVVVMQRLSENDLVGKILERDTQHEWVHLMLPMRAELGRLCSTPWGRDPRTTEGELLCPERWSEEAVREIEIEMGSQVAAAQLQQRPAPQKGNIFQRAWFLDKFTYLPLRWKTIPEPSSYVLSADCTFKDSANADYVALHVWAASGGRFYLVDRIHDRMGLPQTIACILSLCKRYPQIRAKLIEDKANGPAVEQMLRGKLSGIIMMEPARMGGSKIGRANAVSPLVEAGNVILPDLTVRDFGDEVLEELVTFPHARHDDDVDACTQALIYLHDRDPSRYLAAMSKIKSGEVKYSYGLEQP